MLKKLSNFFKGDNLKAKCARSSGILGVGTVADKGLAFVSKMILVRLLLPEEIGLMVLILSLTAMFEVFTEVGIKQSVIQHKNGATPGYLNMAWWFQSVRATCLFAVAFLAVPFVCKFYFAGKAEILDNHTYQELFLLVRLAFLSILFNGFISPRAHVLEKEFKFFKSVLIIQGSAIIGTIITIGLALIYRNVWAMVIGFVSMAMLRCLLSFILCPFMPRLKFDKDSFGELLHFAKGMFGLPVLAYLAVNIDVLVAGKMVPVGILGMYGMAFALARIPRELFSRIIAPTLLPAFAEKQGDHEALCAAVLKLTRLTALITFPAVAIIALCSNTILSIVYGKEFSAIAIPFILLCVYVMLLLQGGAFTSVFLAIGQPAKHRLFVVVRAIILVMIIYPSIKVAGLTGAAFSVLFANVIALFFQVRVASDLIELKTNKYFISWLPGCSLSLPVLLVVGLLKIFIPSYHLLHLSAGLACLTISFGIVFVLKNKNMFQSAKLLNSVAVEREC